ncbi:hypothetical protein DL546_000672 [Coniochaeta pulveracea]|uniref:Methyltransferase type 11 domain-containing protein n=1 Tax=Coniochaeta pulveracea TaxID=177199 RepID=A0A420YA92_9PEZI|nr:hypothetical protein DL546_000672 [Coniochaeta pulveracea]
MAPLVPRMHVFEIDDQPWFPSFLRAKVQAALTRAWTTEVPFFELLSPANLAARVLASQLGPRLRSYVFIDFCAGGGGPTPSIERHLNGTVLNLPSTSGKPSYAEAVDNTPCQFVLTDLHPHVEEWRVAARESRNVSFEPRSVDAANVPKELVDRYKREGKKVCRLFSLAFHHFDDPLAKSILRNTVETGDAFAIFELQERNIASFFTLLAFGLGIFVTAPYFAWKWRSPVTIIFTYLIPILPFVLVFDGWMSALRTRTPDEVEALLRTCGAEAEELSRWEVRSGREMFFWPVGNLNWIVCERR